MSEKTVNKSELSLRSGPRDPIHDSITKDQISNLVDQFYNKVRDNDRLGPLFQDRIDENGGDWEPHLAKMKKFWASVLLKTGEYKGQPVVVHNGLSNLRETDFLLWLQLFHATLDEVMEPGARQPVFDNARRIAQSLYLARFGSAGTTPPF